VNEVENQKLRDRNLIRAFTYGKKVKFEELCTKNFLKEFDKKKLVAVETVHPPKPEN